MNELIEISLIGFFTLVLVVFLIHFLARRISKRIGENVCDPILEAKRQPLVRPGFVLTLILIFFGIPLIWKIIIWWPPRWIERQEQRKQVALRIAEAGGYSNLVRACVIFSSTNDFSKSFRPSFRTNVDCPREILVMQPRHIGYEQWKGFSVVKLQLYGMHRSGAKGTPFYTLMVVTEKSREVGSDELEHAIGKERSIRQIGDDVFEVY